MAGFCRPDVVTGKCMHPHAGRHATQLGSVAVLWGGQGPRPHSKVCPSLCGPQMKLSCSCIWRNLVLQCCVKLAKF